MQILYEERKLYRAESEINTGVFLKGFWKIAVKLMKGKRSTRNNVDCRLKSGVGGEWLVSITRRRALLCIAESDRSVDGKSIHPYNGAIRNI